MLPSYEGDRFEDLYFDLMGEVDTYITNVYSERQKRIVANRLGRSAAIPNSSQQQQIVKLPPSEADAREVTFKDIQVSVDYQRDSLSDLDHIESLVSGTTPLMHLSEVIDTNHEEICKLTQLANEDSLVQHATCNVQVNHLVETHYNVALERVIDDASVIDIVVEEIVDNAKHDITVEKTVDNARHNVAVEKVADFTKDDWVSHRDTDEPENG